MQAQEFDKTIGYAEWSRGKWYFRAMDQDGCAYNFQGDSPEEAEAKFLFFVEQIRDSANG